VSTSGPRQSDAIRRALDVTVDGRPVFTSIQSTWNLLEPSAGPALAEAAEAGATVIVKEAVANGRLAPGGGGSTVGERSAAKAAEDLGVGVDQLAIAVALAQPWAWRVLSGAVSPEQLRANAGAESIAVPEQLSARLGSLAEPPSEYWAARSHRAWT